MVDLIENKENKEQNDLLQYAIIQGIIDLADVRKDMQEKEKQRILRKPPYDIWQSNDGRWKTYLPDEMKAKRT